MLAEPVPANPAEPPFANLTCRIEKARWRFESDLIDSDGIFDKALRTTRREQIDGLRERYRRLEEESGRLLDLANYHRLVERYRYFKIWLVGASVAAAAGMAGFAYAATKPADPAPPTVLSDQTLTLAAGANLAKADLSGAKITGAPGAELSGADLSGATLGGDFRKANLAGARLGGARFVAADLSGADLTGAKGLNPARVAGVTDWSNARCPNGDRIVQVEDTCLDPAERLTP